MHPVEDARRSCRWEKRSIPPGMAGAMLWREPTSLCQMGQNVRHLEGGRACSIIAGIRPGDVVNTAEQMTLDEHVVFGIDLGQGNEIIDIHVNICKKLCTFGVAQAGLDKPAWASDVGGGSVSMSTSRGCC
eukprot:11053719-Ditylum_brightwellii.AAC.1